MKNNVSCIKDFACQGEWLENIMESYLFVFSGTLIAEWCLNECIKTRKREEIYRMFSELAAHPNPKGFAMLRPQGMDAQGGPFFDPTAFLAVLAELGRLSVQVGEIVIRFFPDDYERAAPACEQFGRTKLAWVDTFYKDKS